MHKKIELMYLDRIFNSLIIRVHIFYVNFLYNLEFKMTDLHQGSSKFNSLLKILVDVEIKWIHSFSFS